MWIVVRMAVEYLRKSECVVECFKGVGGAASLRVWNEQMGGVDGRWCGEGSGRWKGDKWSDVGALRLWLGK